MGSSASDYFGAMVEEYDSLIHRCVPRYDEMIARTVEYMPEDAERIVEYGCGTGNLTLAVAARFPSAALTLVDGSADMLELSARRLGKGRYVELVEGRFEEVVLPDRSFDLAVSTISLHHVQDKRALFERIHAVLRSGGTFVLTDQMRGQTTRNHAVNWDRMLEFWHLPGHCTDEESRSLLEHAEAHDHYATVVDQVRLLETAGFRDVDCVWRNWMWGILTARA